MLTRAICVKDILPRGKSLFNPTRSAMTRAPEGRLNAGRWVEPTRRKLVMRILDKHIRWTLLLAPKSWGRCWSIRKMGPFICDGLETVRLRSSNRDRSGVQCNRRNNTANRYLTPWPHIAAYNIPISEAKIYSRYRKLAPDEVHGRRDIRKWNTTWNQNSSIKINSPSRVSPVSLGPVFCRHIPVIAGGLQH